MRALLGAWPYALAVGLALAALFGAYSHGVTVADDRWKARWAEQGEFQAKATTAAEISARAEEQRRQSAANEVGENARAKSAAAAADGVAADAAGDGVRDAASKLAATAGNVSCDTGAAQRGAAATRAARVLSELFQRADRRAGELAKAYDQSRIAGLACEAAYGALRVSLDQAPQLRDR